MAWMPLSDRLDDLPLILAGPIVRRTERHTVTVWLALKKPRTVTLRIYSDNAGTLTEKLVGTRQTTPLGQHLHVIAVTADRTPDDQSAEALDWGGLYYYNLFFLADSSSTDLPETADNLNTPDVLNKNSANPPAPIDLSYSPQSPHPLPGFVLPPQNLNEVRIIHASCRKPHGQGLDAMTALDQIIEATTLQPDKRPHQLFLTGDQIYADDVADALLFMLTEAGQTLLGWDELLPTVNKTPQALKPGEREDIAEDECGFTSGEAKSHLLGVGEYYAMYLFCWSQGLWPSDLPPFEEVFPGKPTTFSDGHKTALFNNFEEEIERLNHFRQELIPVRRALANVSTYMIFDDHEITDDWYLRLEWCQDVLSKPLGLRVLQNGLLAYAIFQAWGNTPNLFEAAQPGATLLNEAAIWRGQADSHETQIRNLLGIPDVQTIIQNKALIHPAGSLDWHYRLEGPNYTVIVLDTRTWRGFPEDEDDPPALLTEAALRQQIPQTIEPNPEIVFVISPTPVIGVPFADAIQDFFAFFSRNFADYEAWRLQKSAVERIYARLAQTTSIIDDKQQTRVILLGGDVHYGYAVRLQYWAKQPFADDVSAPTSPPETPPELIIAQLTSSSLKNEAGPTRLLHNGGYIPFEIFSDSLPDTQKWAGWNIPPGEDEIQIGTAAFIPFLFFIQKPWLLDEPPALLYLNDLSPSDNITVEPDWRYQIDFLLAENEIGEDDVRGEPPFKPGEIPPPAPNEDRKKALQRYLAVAEDHEDYARKWGDGKEIVGVNNIAEITFNWPTEENKTVIQQLWWRLENRAEDDEDDNLLKPFPLTKHVISLRFDDPNYPEPEIN